MQKLPAQQHETATDRHNISSTIRHRALQNMKVHAHLVQQALQLLKQISTPSTSSPSLEHS